MFVRDFEAADELLKCSSRFSAGLFSAMVCARQPRIALSLSSALVFEKQPDEAEKAEIDVSPT